MRCGSRGAQTGHRLSTGRPGVEVDISGDQRRRTPQMQVGRTKSFPGCEMCLLTAPLLIDFL